VTKPKVFIASSSEGLDAAQAIRGLPAADAHVTMWDEGFELDRAGTVSIRLFDAPPQMRAYVFDGEDGMSFFVPYAPRSTTRPLPVYHCRNGGAVARRYTAGIERLRNGGDTLTLQQFLDVNDPFRAGDGPV
jgi:hypothetical protein